MNVAKGVKGWGLAKWSMFFMVLLTALAPAFAFAAIDITAATTEFTGLSTAIVDLGELMITAVVAGVAAKWVVAYLI